MNKQPVYSPTQAALGAFLGGPLASVLFIKKNFNSLGKPEAEKKTLLYGTALSLALIGLLPFLPEQFPNMAIPIATVVTTRAIVEKHQFRKQAISDSETLTFQSNWRVLWVALACLLVFFVAIVAVTIVLDSLGITADA